MGRIFENVSVDTSFLTPSRFGENRGHNIASYERGWQLAAENTYEALKFRNAEAVTVLC